MGSVLPGEQDIDVADLPDSLTDTHYHPGLFQLVQGTLAGLGLRESAAAISMTGKRMNRIPLLSSVPLVRISSSRRAYMTFAVLLTGNRSIAFGSGIQGGSGVLAIINS